MPSLSGLSYGQLLKVGESIVLIKLLQLIGVGIKGVNVTTANKAEAPTQ